MPRPAESTLPLASRSERVTIARATAFFLATTGESGRWVREHARRGHFGRLSTRLTLTIMNRASHSSLHHEVRSILNALKKYRTADKRHIRINGVTCSIAELAENMEAHAAFLERAAVYERHALRDADPETVAERPSSPSLCSFVVDQFGEDSEFLDEVGHHPHRIQRRTVGAAAHAAFRFSKRCKRAREIEAAAA